MSDDIDRLLQPPDSPPTPGLRDRLRAETTRRLRRGRRTRRLAVAAALAACYVGGALTIWFARPTPKREVMIVEREVEKKTSEISPAVRPEPARSPHDLELAAEQADGSERGRLFIEAGRAYARIQNGPQALSCYRNARDVLGELPPLDTTNDDLWLTIVKTERSTTNANP